MGKYFQRRGVGSEANAKVQQLSPWMMAVVSSPFDKELVV